MSGVSIGEPTADGGARTHVTRVSRADDYGWSNSEINLRATARRDEIVIAWDGWQAEMQAVRNRCAYTPARAEWLAAANRYEVFRLRLIHLQTTDRDVMAVKAAIVAE